MAGTAPNQVARAVNPAAAHLVAPTSRAAFDATSKRDAHRVAVVHRSDGGRT